MAVTRFRNSLDRKIQAVCDRDTIVLSEFDTKMHEWFNETFFKDDSIDEAELNSGVSWIYSSDGQRSPQTVICNSPTTWFEIIDAHREKGCTLPIFSESKTWQQIKMNIVTKWFMSDTGYLEDLLQLLRILPQSDFEYLGAIFLFGESHETCFATRARYSYCMDNLVNRYIEIASYDFLGLIDNKYLPRLSTYVKHLKSGCFISAFLPGLAVILRRPSRVMTNKDGLLHCDGGSAMEWRGSDAKFYLNGIMVSEEVAVTPGHLLDPILVLKEKNAVVRMEIVKKIGIERLVNKLGGKVLDRWQDYELIRLNIPGMGKVPTYLKMINPSMGTYHVEGVPPQIKTCKAALNWRVGGVEWNPEQLT